jgi:hypothetical protein
MTNANNVQSVGPIRAICYNGNNAVYGSIFD